MSKQHYPGANTTAQYWAGKFVGSTMNTNCACLHTTEGFTWPSYGGGASAPHMTILPNIKARTISLRQHFPAGKSSRALVNLAGGVETNTLNVFQIEFIGTCDSRYRERWGNKVAGVDYIYWPDAPDWLLEAIAPVFQWLDAEWDGFKIVDATPRGWVRYPDSYGVGAKQRMTAREWANAYGIFGHQHVPENAHGDPGNFPIARLVEFATGKPATPAPTPDPPKPTVPKPAQTAVWDLSTTWEIGSTGTAVTKLGQRLVVHGFATHHDGDGYQPGPVFTTYDRDNLADFQRAQGWKDEDADGFPGPETFRRLAANPEPDPEPDPPRPATQRATVMTLNLGSRNADVNKAMGPWSKRVKEAAAFILEQDADYVAAQELYALQRPALDKLIASRYVVDAVRGGRVLYRNVDVDAKRSGGSKWTDLLPGVGTKYAVARKYVYPSGAVLNLANAHLSYETSSAGVKKRAKEVPAFVKWVRSKFPTGYDLYVGDFNAPAGGTTRPDDVGPIFSKYGLRDLRHDVNAKVGRGAYHLDRGFAGLIKASRIRVIANRFTDHPATIFTVVIPTK